MKFDRNGIWKANTLTKMGSLQTYNLYSSIWCVVFTGRREKGTRKRGVAEGGIQGIPHYFDDLIDIRCVRYCGWKVCLNTPIRT